MSTVVDAHVHFWDPAPEEYPWMTGDYAAIRRRFGPEDLRPELVARGVSRSILVQTRSSLDETREFLALAEATEFIAGVVGWVDLVDPSVADTIAELRAGPAGDKLVGIRHQVQDEPDPDWLLRADVRRGLQAVEVAGLAYDLLVRPRELSAALATVRALPGLRFVIDHLAKPPIRSGVLEPWATLLQPIGDLPNASCKVAGLVTEADWERWRPDDFIPYVRQVVEVFGPERLLFGSDWPVCLVAASYVRVFDVASLMLEGLTPAERARMFGENAIAVYRLAV